MKPELLLIVYNYGYSKAERDLLYHWFALFPESEKHLPINDEEFLSTFTDGLLSNGGKDTLYFLDGSPEDRAKVAEVADAGKWFETLTLLNMVYGKCFKADQLVEAFRKGE